MNALKTLLTVFFSAGTVALAAAESVRTEANVPVEIRFVSGARVAQSDQVELDAVFAAPDGSQVRVPAFWAGGNVWKVRYASNALGRHRYRTEVRGDIAGLVGQEGVVEIEPYTGDNPLYRHGPVRVAGNRRLLEYQDGTPFFWLGDTWWLGLSENLSWPHGFRTLAADRKSKGFTLIQIVGGLPPHRGSSDKGGVVDGRQAWSEDFASLRPEFYEAADLRIAHLVELGLVPCIVTPWSDDLPVMGTAKTKRHWRNLVARYGAYPVVWCLGGEINRTIAGADFLEPRPGGGADAAAVRAAWTDVARYLRAIDPYRRVVAAHTRSDDPVLDEATLLDLHFLRSGHSGLSSISAQVESLKRLQKTSPRAPVVFGEGNYQGLFADGNFSDHLQRHQFWVTLLEGGAGHTYGASGLWQANRPGTPVGPAAHGSSRSNQPWPEAMYHAASSQLGWSRRFIEEVPWTRLTAASHKVRYVDPALPPIKGTGARWIAPTEASDKANVVVGTVMVPADSQVRRAILRVSCEAPYDLSVNDQLIHGGSDQAGVSGELRHEPHGSFPLLGEYLRPGQNSIRFHFKAGVLRPGAGLLAQVWIELTDGRIVEGATDGKWRWGELGSSWPGDVLESNPQRGLSRVRVLDVEAYPDEELFKNSGASGPRCAEIPGEHWLIYVPAAHPIEVTGLPAGGTLHLTVFNPVTGEQSAPTEVRVDAAGWWRSQPPPEAGDRVLRLSMPRGR